MPPGSDNSADDPCEGAGRRAHRHSRRCSRGSKASPSRPSEKPKKNRLPSTPDLSSSASRSNALGVRIRGRE
jgi:hypothetical protein